MDVRWIISFFFVITTKRLVVWARECSTSESVACRQEIQDLREDKSRYYYASDDGTLTEMCRKQVLAVSCVNSFAEDCLSDEDQAYFKTLVLGSDKFLDTLCFKDSELRKAYLQHSPCIRNITEELDDCSQKYQAAQKELDSLQEDTKILLEKTCCIYFENIQCSSNVTIETCGQEASKLVKDLLTLLSGTYLTERCQPYSRYDPGRCILVSKGLPLMPQMWIIFIAFFTFCQRLK